MNYAIVYMAGILAFAGIYWFVYGRKYYTGPVVEAEVHDASGGASSDDEIQKTKGLEPQTEAIKSQ